MYNLDPAKIKQLHQQDMHTSNIIDKCKLKVNDNTHYYLDEHGITYRKIREGPHLFHTIMVPNTSQPYILYESHTVLGLNGSTRICNFIRRHYYWKKLHQHCNIYVQLCPQYQQVNLKEPQNINLHLPIPQFPISFISMDFPGPYCKTEKGYQYLLTGIRMLTNYVFMIPIRSNITEEVTKVYLMSVYSTFRGSKHILSDRESKYTSKELTSLANTLGFI